MELHKQRCIPYRGGVPALLADRAAALYAFVNRAGANCEEQGHHADCELGWGRVRARNWTHKIDGLTAEADRMI